MGESGRWLILAQTFLWHFRCLKLNGTRCPFQRFLVLRRAFQRGVICQNRLRIRPVQASVTDKHTNKQTDIGTFRRARLLGGLRPPGRLRQLGPGPPRASVGRSRPARLPLRSAPAWQASRSLPHHAPVLGPAAYASAVACGRKMTHSQHFEQLVPLDLLTSGHGNRWPSNDMP